MSTRGLGTPTRYRACKRKFLFGKELSTISEVVESWPLTSRKASGQFLWQEQGVQPTFFRDRGTGFTMSHDGHSHEYYIAFTAAHPVTAIRLDPGQAASEIRVSAMKPLDASDRLVYEWRFVAVPPDKPLK